MVIWLGTCSFGAVIGWVAAFVFYHNRPAWREVKSTLAVLFGAAAQAVFGGTFGVAVYGAGVIIGIGLYGTAFLIQWLRRVHDITM